MRDFLNPYAAAIRLRNAAYDRGWRRTHRAAVPVVSVGNLSVGGTGKTPVAMALLELLAAAGRSPAYLSRGYGRDTKGYLRVGPEAVAAQTGDEALMVARRFPAVPVAVCEDRVAGVARLVAEAPIDCVVLDDAFQHRRIARDLDLVLIDATRPLASERLLPFGRLREPVSSLRRADLLIYTKLPPGESVPEATPFGLSALGCRYRIVDWCDASGTPVAAPAEAVAFSGLGNNAQFAAQLAAAGVAVREFFPFRDHQRYRPQELVPAQRAARKWAVPLVTTEKDVVRLLDSPALPKLTRRGLVYPRLALEWVAGEEVLRRSLSNL